LLAFARLSASQVENGPVDLRRVVREVIGGLRQNGIKDVDIRVDEPLPWVKAHPAVLEQAVRNLAENAVKFVSRDRRPVLHIYAQCTAQTVKLHVADNGVGIASADAKRVFKMFERLRPDEYPGTGVGLAIVQRAVQKCNGRIGFESEPGRGSTFWIEMQRSQNLNVPNLSDANQTPVYADAGDT
jgi:signal transduction histidine kinase